MTRFAAFLCASLAASLPCRADQAALDQKFDDLIHPDDLRGWMKQMASEPNQVGSPHDKANAEFQLARFKAWGWDARIETFEILYPTPISETAELIGASPFKATLTEPPIPSDPSSPQMANALPAYVAYQGDGDVQAGLVYVNFGMKDDYETLARLGVDVRGKIVIARYGRGWRGLKPKLAQDHGAAGCLIYSDPEEDGYAVEKTYPDGPMRPPHGIQRGSVADMTLYPGDPLTPGIAPVPGAKRLKREEAATILKIPVLPISYADAQVFLAALGGPVGPADWRGALPITYHVGPGTAEVHLAVKSDWSMKTIYDVIAVMRGATYPDQWVVRGNHHDGWVFGASDPLSGQVGLMAEAQAIGTLVHGGWHPKRTLVYASWDAEEPMLVGSTAWAQAHYDELRKKAVLYVNSDYSSRGVLGAAGSHDFQHVVNEVAAGITDPETHVSIAARERAGVRIDALSDDATDQDTTDAKLVAQPGHDFPLGALGSGSDYSPFLQHLGLPAINLLFDGEGDQSGIYHSAYDTFTHHSTWVDPGFVYDALLAKTAGHLVLRVSESDLPLQRAGDFSEMVDIYLQQVKKLADKKREDAETRTQLLRDHAYVLAADPQHPMRPPPSLDPVPYIDFAPLENAAKRLEIAAKTYDDALAEKGASLSPESRTRLMALMQTIDQTLAPPVGLPGRPWYKNLIYAPGRFTGYGAKTLPGVREAIEERRWPDADRYAKLTADALDAYSARLAAATSVLEGKGS
jgi:N-acetylated-alpha-linked acidic dipeptidase